MLERSDLVRSKSRKMPLRLLKWLISMDLRFRCIREELRFLGSSTVTAADVMATKPDVVSHINGGPTAISLEEVDKIMDGTDFALEIVQCGN